MSHVEAVNLDIEKLIECEPIRATRTLTKTMWVFVLVGMAIFMRAVFFGDPALAWGAFYTNVIFWMGLAVGACIIPAIFQIVRAQWSPPVRRIAEANVAFLPWAYFALLTSYFGREHLFPWARAPMPGREYWMSPDFVYLRFGLLMPLLFFLIWRFVRMSLRTDVGMIKEHAKHSHKWSLSYYDTLTSGWKGTVEEVREIQPRLSRFAPVLVFAYAIIFSLFAFEMIMSMDVIWYSNMFGGFIFIGNIYMGWAVLSILVSYLSRHHKEYARTLTDQQFWDLGKLTFGFCILWGYLFFSQFLPQWYGNLPEETQWMILRTREYPWKIFGWTVLSLCFVLPFILLLSRDVKKIPATLSAVCAIVLLGMYLERYIIVMPQLSPGAIPFGITEIGVFLGFLGVYVLSINGFLSRFPFIPVSSPLSQGSTDW
ncbi:MAG: hypothetical protein J5J00_10540 [Deltaproteobacteria bacterium]|nr:hypothetical protein [Deltaproteobacteria bacterium]